MMAPAILVFDPFRQLHQGLGGAGAGSNGPSAITAYIDHKLRWWRQPNLPTSGSPD